MKLLSLLAGLVVLLLPLHAKAETVAWGTNEVVLWQLHVPTNHVMLIEAAGRFYKATPQTLGFMRFTQGTNSYTSYNPPHEIVDELWGKDHPITFSGPLQVELQMGQFQYETMLTYRILPVGGVSTMFFDTNVPTRSVAVPAGKSFRILSDHAVDNCLVTAGPVVALVSFASVRLIDGPVNVEVSPPAPPGGFAFLTYAVEDSAISVLTGGAISTAGGAALSVERSPDLTNWNPATIMLNDGSPQSFYRLKASD